MSNIPQLMSGRTLEHDAVTDKQWVSRGAETYVTLFSDFILDVGEAPQIPFVYSESTSNTTGTGIDAPDGVLRLLHTDGNDEAQAALLSLGGTNAIAAKNAAGDSNEVVFEARVAVRLDTDSTFAAAQDYTVFVGMVTAGTAVATATTVISGTADNVGFQLGSDSGTLNIFVQSDVDGGSDSTLLDSGVDFVSGTFVTLKIDMTDLSNVLFFIDGVDARNGNTFDMSAIAATDYLEPFLIIARATNTGTERAHGLDIDYVKCTWKRS